MSRKKRPSSGGGLRLLDGDLLRSVMEDRLNSREWWTFISISAYGAQILSKIEGDHFTGRHAKDFEMVMIPALQWGLGLVAIFFARKTRLSLKELSGYFDKFGMVREAEALAKGTKDIIALLPEEFEAYDRLVGFMNQFYRVERA